MAIRSITIKNFKGIGDRVTIDLKPITLLFGKNSSGKSSIIHALHYAYEVIVRQNLDPNFTELGGSQIDLGGFENIVHGHDRSKSISLRFDMDLTGKSLPLYYNNDYYRFHTEDDEFAETNLFRWNIRSEDLFSSWVEIEVSFHEANQVFFVSKYEVGLNDDVIVRVAPLTETKKAAIQYINFFHPLLTRRENKLKEAIRLIYSEKESTYDFEQIYYLEELIDDLLDDCDLCLKPRIFPSDEYERLENIVRRYRKSKEKYTEALKLVFKELSKEMSGKAREKKAEKIKEFFLKCKTSNLDVILELARYEFLFFSMKFFGLTSLDDSLNIVAGSGDALLNVENPYGLWLEMVPSEDKYDASWHKEALRCAISQFVLGPGKILRDELKELHYLGPIRYRIPRSYEPNRYIENSNWADGTAAWDVLHKGSVDFIEKVGHWLSQRLKSGYHIFRKTYREIDTSDNIENLTNISKTIVQKFSEARTRTRLCLMDEDNDIEVHPSDVGTGISQVLPIVVAALYFKEGIVAIEQPELHIHPALQVELGDLFINEATRKNLVFLIETHSEHLLLRILRRIRETNDPESRGESKPFNPEDLAIYFIDKDKTGIVISPIRVDKEGDFIDHWPKGFFAERSEELF